MAGGQDVCNSSQRAHSECDVMGLRSGLVDSLFEPGSINFVVGLPYAPRSHSLWYEVFNELETHLLEIMPKVHHSSYSKVLSRQSDTIAVFDRQYQLH